MDKNTAYQVGNQCCYAWSWRCSLRHQASSHKYIKPSLLYSFATPLLYSLWIIKCARLYCASDKSHPPREKSRFFSFYQKVSQAYVKSVIAFITGPDENRPYSHRIHVLLEYRRSRTSYSSLEKDPLFSL